VEGVEVGQADPDRPGAAGAVHRVAAEPLRQHLHLGLGGEVRVHTAGLPVGGVAVAPDVVRAAERGVVRRVLAGQVGRGRVLHTERAARLGGGNGDRVGAAVGRGAGAVHDVLLRAQDLAGERVDVDG